MVIGNGDLASVLPKNREILYFASGVSNSKCTDKKQFDREVRLLKKQPKSKKIVYFSTLSIYFKDTPYTKHKIKMEKLVKKYFRSYCIIRIGNIAWGRNPHTIINYFKDCIQKGVEPKLLNEYKFIINKEEFLFWVNRIPKFNTEINITGKKISVHELYNNLKHDTNTFWS